MTKEQKQKETARMLATGNNLAQMEGSTQIKYAKRGKTVRHRCSTLRCGRHSQVQETHKGRKWNLREEGEKTRQQLYQMRENKNIT